MTLLISLLILSSISSSTSAFSYEENDPETSYQKTFTCTFSENDLLFSTQNNYDVVHLSEGGYETDPGKPMVPLKNIQIALPPGMKATAIQVIDVKQRILQGNFDLIPAQQAFEIGTSPNNSSFVQPDRKTYQSTQPYPSQYVELSYQNDLAGQSIVHVTLYPLHYYPSQKKLCFVTSLTFTIIGVSGYVCNDYLSPQISETGYEMYEEMLQNTVINPDEVSLQYSPQPHSAGVDPGDYDYVIITQESWVGAFEPLKEWKTKKGIPSAIVTTNWIYNNGGYSGSNVEKIRAFVQDVYTNWGTIYVLLGGDIDVVPCHYKTFTSVDPDPVPNDAYYADFDSDYTCEVNVGRASVTGPGSGSGQIGNFITKILTYEKDPPLSDFAKNAGFFGFDLDSSTHAQQCKINIDSQYIPASWAMTTVYDSQGGNHKTNVIAALNAGQNLANHADHSSPTFMGTGYVNHDLGLYNSDMDALTNGNKQGILYSMGCDPAAYDSSDCIGEHFVQNSNGGGVAFIGNSRYGWYYVGQYNSLSLGYDMEFFESVFQDNLYKLGAAFSDHKNDEVGISSVSKYCFTELTLLGDPELPIWTENPMIMTATYPGQIPLGSSQYTVTVSTGKTPVPQALVCLWKGTDIYMTGTTDSAGQITFTLSPATTGTMYVTITKQNYLPYEGQTMVTDGTNSPPLKPNTPTGPTTGGLNIEYTYSTSTTDPDQDQVWYQWKFGSYTTSWVGPFSSGATAEIQYSWSTTGTFEVSVKAKDQNDLESDWSTPLIVTILDLKPFLTIEPITGGLFAVATEIQNSGEIAATNLEWEITLTGPFIFSGETMTGSISTLNVGSSATIENSPVIGFGNIVITVSIRADGVPEITESTNGFLFFIYVIL